MSHKILISNQSKAFTKLQEWCDDLSFELMRTSFINTSPISGLEIPITEWIFFSSPKCAETYLDTYSLHAKKIAVYGKGTAETVLERGHKIEFVGPSTSETVEIARALEEVVHGSIFFPISQISRKSIIQELGSLNCTSIVTYRTEITPKKLTENPTIIIFTSPSNIRGFLMQNELDETIPLIAFGKTTALEIQAMKLKNPCYTLATPSEVDMINALENIL